MNEEATGIVEGIVEKLTFHNPDSLYTVLRLTSLRNDREVVTVVGKFLDPRVGQRYSVKGHWIEHKEYGRQFNADAYEELMPSTAHGIERFLASGLIKGVGEATARRVVGVFADDTLRIIEEEPHRLGEIPNLAANKIKALVDGLAEHRELKNVMTHLSGFDLSPGLIMRIYRHYGGACVRVIQQNPYQLCEDVWGVGFKTADRVAQRMGLDPLAPARVQAGLMHVLQEAQDNGHLYLAKEMLGRRAAEALEVPGDVIEQCLASLIEQQRVVLEDDCVYLTAVYHLEKRIAERVQRLLTLSPLPRPDDDDVAGLQNLLRVTLAPLQQQSLRQALASGIFIMTGGPGTGKTTTVRSILEWCRKKGLEVRLAAPTGRAAKRLTETTGETGVTLHRLLEWSVSDHGFLRGEHQPLVLDVLIVDEASMLDVYLFHAVLAALPADAHLLLVGDADQLPSVGPGQVLADLISSAVVPVVHLSQIFRQGAGSQIIENSHRINSGQLPETPREGVSDFYFVREKDTEAVANRLVEYVSERLRQRWDPLTEIQVLAPMYRGSCGIDKLNERLQEKLNPDGLKVPGLSFRLGDKVMQLRNNYDKGTFNGDMGVVVSADMDAKEFVVRFISGQEESPEAIYGFHEAQELTLAYACSVHKSQGSEFPVVLMPIVMQHFVMLQRNLMYTAVSRARKLMVLVGQPQALARAVRNDEVVKRNSRLAWRLKTP